MLLPLGVDPQAVFSNWPEAPPPSLTDYLGGQYPADHVLFFIGNGNSWAFNDGSKHETRENKVIAAKEDLAVPLRFLDTCFQNVVYVIPTRFWCLARLNLLPLIQTNYRKHLFSLIMASKMHLFDGKALYAGCAPLLHPTDQTHLGHIDGLSCAGCIEPIARHWAQF